MGDVYVVCWGGWRLFLCCRFLEGILINFGVLKVGRWRIV